jgi:hypothetical protein
MDLEFFEQTGMENFDGYWEVKRDGNLDGACLSFRLPGLIRRSLLAFGNDEPPNSIRFGMCIAHNTLRTPLHDLNV